MDLTAKRLDAAWKTSCAFEERFPSYSFVLEMANGGINIVVAPWDELSNYSERYVSFDLISDSCIEDPIHEALLKIAKSIEEGGFRKLTDFSHEEDEDEDEGRCKKTLDIKVDGNVIYHLFGGNGSD